jgi:cell division protein FtsQ
MGQYITQHPYFTISEIVIETETPFSEEDIRRWSGLTTETNLWTVNAAQIGEQLMAHPGIRTATVEREFPQRVRIAVMARKPIAVVVQEAVTFIDETGAVFAHEQAYPLDFPFVSGLAGIPLDTLEARTAIAGILPLLSLTRLWPERLSEIHWDAQQGYTVFLTQRQVSIRLGWEVTPEKFTQVGAVLAHWPTNGPAVLFDARFADQVVVRPDTEILRQTVFHPTQPL